MFVRTSSFSEFLRFGTIPLLCSLPEGVSGQSPFCSGQRLQKSRLPSRRPTSPARAAGRAMQPSYLLSQIEQMTAEQTGHPGLAGRCHPRPASLLLLVHTHQILNRRSLWRRPWDGEALPTCTSVSPEGEPLALCPAGWRPRSLGGRRLFG